MTDNPSRNNVKNSEQNSESVSETSDAKITELIHSEFRNLSFYDPKDYLSIRIDLDTEICRKCICADYASYNLSRRFPLCERDISNQHIFENDGMTYLSLNFVLGKNGLNGEIFGTFGADSEFSDLSQKVDPQDQFLGVVENTFLKSGVPYVYFLGYNPQDELFFCLNGYKFLGRQGNNCRLTKSLSIEPTPNTDILNSLK